MPDSLFFRRKAKVQLSEFDVEGMRVQFSVERVFRSIPSSLELKVYNLSDQTRSQIIQTSRQRARAVPPQPGVIQPRRRVFVSLFAGYETAPLSRQFYGDVFLIRNEVVTPDIITVVSAKDGGYSAMTSRVNRSFAPGTSVETVARHLVDCLGVEPGNALEQFRGMRLSDASVFHAGTLLVGSATREMDRLCLAAGFEWCIQDNRLVVTRIRQGVTDTAILLSPETGLIGSPIRESISRIVKGRCLIQPGIVPGAIVEVQSRLFKSVIRLYRTRTIGDTHGADWYIDFEGRPPLPPERLRELQP